MKKILISLLAVFCLSSAYSETVSQKQASQLAQLFFNEAAGRVVAPPKLVYNGRKLTTARLFTPFYIYNNLTGGFVIISAENKAFPILGFSLKEPFDPNNLGNTELALLKSYAQEIEYVRYNTDSINTTISAWINYPEYVKNILDATYEATDPLFTPQEADKIIELAEIKEDAIYSDIYTPAQWQEMIEEDLLSNKSVPLIFAEGNNYWPAVIYGRQGDYFRIEMDKRNNWLMRLNATEVISTNMISAVVNPLDISLEIEEQLPFAEYDDFIEEVMLDEITRTSLSSIDSVGADGMPFVRPLGSGHYEVITPEEVYMASIYNLSGALVSQQTFSESEFINIDIAPEPRGFYFLNVIGASGKSYGIKLVR